MLRENFDGGMIFSYAEIASVINKTFGTNFSRNATIGRGSRLGLVCIKKIKFPKPKTAKPKRIRPQRPDVPHSKPRTEPKPFVPRPDPRPGLVPLLELAVDGCRWPSGEGPFVFCNSPQYESLPYCGAHAGLAYRVPEPRRNRQ
jgi:GcrA cell cycle regulator